MLALPDERGGSAQPPARPLTSQGWKRQLPWVPPARGATLRDGAPLGKTLLGWGHEPGGGGGGGGLRGCSDGWQSRQRKGNGFRSPWSRERPNRGCQHPPAASGSPRLCLCLGLERVGELCAMPGLSCAGGGSGGCRHRCAGGPGLPAAPACFAKGGLAVAAGFVQSSLHSARLPLASSAFKFPERLPFLLSTQFKENKTQAPREAAAGLCLCEGPSVSPNSRPQTKQEAFHSKAARSKAAEGSLHRFMLCNPTFGKFYVNCVQISFEKFLCSSLQSHGWTTRAAGAAPCPAPPRGAGGRNLEI